MTLAARAVLVTGAAHRIGRAIALGFARDGWTVAVHYLTSEVPARALVAEIEERGGRAAAIRADLSLEAETVDLIARAVALVGPLGCLVNNASVFERDGALDATRESWDSHIETNLRAPFVLTQGFARALPPGSDGHVINILDQRVKNITPHFASYTVSKAGLWALTQSLALALAPRIRVNAIGPGPVLPSKRQSADQFAAQYRGTPLRRPTTPEEIYSAVRFLIGAPSVTGQMLALDGGQHLAWTHPGEPGRAEE
jgi:NAD(P)-dependent dehydrogenase (short-subunit alcohol dehydrogenase family)